MGNQVQIVISEIKLRSTIRKYIYIYAHTNIHTHIYTHTYTNTYTQLASLRINFISL